MPTVFRLLVSLLPLLVTPALFYLVADGHLNFGGGEKDIILLIPWLAWSLIFAVSSWIFWRRGYSLSGSSWRSAVVGLAGLFTLGIAIAMYGRFGMGGHF